MRVPCPTCRRLGTVPVAMPHGTVMGYCGKNGESWPQEICQTCCGSGWVTAEGEPAPKQRQAPPVGVDIRWTTGQ